MNLSIDKSLWYVCQSLSICEISLVSKMVPDNSNRGMVSLLIGATLVFEHTICVDIFPSESMDLKTTAAITFNDASQKPWSFMVRDDSVPSHHGNSILDTSWQLIAKLVHSSSTLDGRGWSQSIFKVHKLCSSILATTTTGVRKPSGSNIYR